MRYSVVSRFKATLIGAFLGESLALGQGTQPQSHLNTSKMAILGTQSLISQGRLDINDWIARQQKEFLHLDATDLNSTQVILAILPVALFFHENTIKLRHNLLNLLQIWEYDPVIRDSSLAVGYAISLSLTEKLDPLTIIPQTISFLGETSTSIPQQLLKVHNLLNIKAGLETAQAELRTEEKLSNNIAMAFYCFLSTLEDFRLAVLRAIDHGNFQVQDSATRVSSTFNSQAVGAITGALSGAYNTTQSIPVNWQMLLSQPHPPERGLTSFSQMLELADALVAVWSGVYNHPLDPRELREEKYSIFYVAPISVSAALRVIRSR